ncbi:hypothetical protein [Nonomuraea wenchangensis]|uniref:hypothetical protein n=1 Tax=Nonomuraea wenchangensis TaxID=568860 RepID=UPI0033C5D0AD
MRPAIRKTAFRALIVPLAAALLLGAQPAAQAAAHQPAHQPARRPAHKPAAFPLPDGFQPEGIAIGPGPHAYFGSRATGDVYQADLRTGEGSVISKGPGTPTLGLKTDGHGRLFAAGGTGGDARVIDLRTGAVLKSYRLATGAAFVNDVILMGDAAYFTDSANPVLYKLPLGRGGALPAEAVSS